MKFNIYNNEVSKMKMDLKIFKLNFDYNCIVIILEKYIMNGE